MEEFGSQYEAEVLSNKKSLDRSDLLCFVFDSSDVNSFAYVVNLRVSRTYPWFSAMLNVHVSARHKPNSFIS